MYILLPDRERHDAAEGLGANFYVSQVFEKVVTDSKRAVLTATG